MDIKTTEQIILENEDIAEKILNQEADIKIYENQFKETYHKLWVSFQDIMDEPDDGFGDNLFHFKKELFNKTHTIKQRENS